MTWLKRKKTTHKQGSQYTFFFNLVIVSALKHKNREVKARLMMILVF